MLRTSLPLLLGLALADCSPSGQSPGAVPASAFPVGLAVASPFGYRTEPPPGAPDGAEILPQCQPSEGSFPTDCAPRVTPFTGVPTADYVFATARINELLRGASPEKCRFDAALLFATAHDARCYGPPIVYQAHPDAAAPMAPSASGELPRGDVGLWREEEPQSGQACAAAQLNARLQGVADHTLGALSGLASLICAAVATGQPLQLGTTLDLTRELNAAAAPGVRYAAATIAESGDGMGGRQYSYMLDLKLLAPISQGTQDPVNARIVLVHRPLTGDAYLGRLSYRLDRPGMAPGCPAAGSTLNGSLRYQRGEGDRISLEARSGAFCGLGTDGLRDGLADPGRKLDPVREPTGWGGDFGIFVAEFEPGRLVGNYAYAWQAGPHDGHSRVLNVNVSEPRGEGEIARAFFGYGADIAAAQPEVRGMICNWAGPQPRHILSQYAQYQSLGRAEGRGLFIPIRSQLRYAPTNGCDYDGRGAFRFDADGDGALDTDPARPISNDLMPLMDSDGDGRADEISRSGFVVPSAPPRL